MAVLVSVISVVEQQSQHGGVSDAILQGSGEHGVANHSKITVYLSPARQQQLHQLIPGQRDLRLFRCNPSACDQWGGDRPNARGSPLGTYSHQNASQRVQVGFGSGCQQHL